MVSGTDTRSEVEHKQLQLRSIYNRNSLYVCVSNHSTKFLFRSQFDVLVENLEVGFIVYDLYVQSITLAMINLAVMRAP